MSMLVFVFGDSVAWGLYDDRGGWVGRLWNGRSRLIYNLGVEFSSSLEFERQVGADPVIPGRQTVSIFVAGPRKERLLWRKSHCVHCLQWLQYGSARTFTRS